MQIHKLIAEGNIAVGTAVFTWGAPARADNLDCHRRFRWRSYICTLRFHHKGPDNRY